MHKYPFLPPQPCCDGRRILKTQLHPGTGAPDGASRSLPERPVPVCRSAGTALLPGHPRPPGPHPWQRRGGSFRDQRWSRPSASMCVQRPPSAPSGSGGGRPGRPRCPGWACRRQGRKWSGSPPPGKWRRRDPPLLHPR